MFRRIITITLIVYLLFQVGCATTKVPIASHDYDKLAGEKSVFVQLKNGVQYEMVHFEITETHIKGTPVKEVIEGVEMNTSTNEKIDIALEDVDYIMAKKKKFPLFSFGNCLIGFGAVIAVAAAVYFILPTL